MKTQKISAEYGVHVPSILLPNKDIDLEKWAVIACDQYTQDRNYWEKVESKVQDDPSSLHLIFPEVYLEDGDRTERITTIREKMKSYKGSNLFNNPLQGYMYIERTTNYGRTRKGLVVSIDLERYEWKPDSKELIRATEATIVDRIPPRMEIRRNAPLELPHIMLLVNDKDKLLIEKIGEVVKDQTPTYQTSLMCNSGSISGWLVHSEKNLKQIDSAFETLLEQGTSSDGSCFLFAVGDGNHSLATAKAVWDEYKTQHAHEEGIEDHPARYALVELVNLYDDGLTFEPIHRVLMGTTAKELSSWLIEKLGGTYFTEQTQEDFLFKVEQTNTTQFGFVEKNEFSILESPHPALAVSRLQPALDAFLQAHPHVKIDYIHGSDEVFRLGNLDDTVSILLPPIQKDSFFTTIQDGGPLPRKSFSMGEASEKRFYLECRALF